MSLTIKNNLNKNKIKINKENNMIQFKVNKNSKWSIKMFNNKMCIKQ